jgi:hypothetical protein
MSSKVERQSEFCIASVIVLYLLLWHPATEGFLRWEMGASRARVQSLLLS